MALESAKPGSPNHLGKAPERRRSRRGAPWGLLCVCSWGHQRVESRESFPAGSSTIRDHGTRSGRTLLNFCSRLPRRTEPALWAAPGFLFLSKIPYSFFLLLPAGLRPQLLRITRASANRIFALAPKIRSSAKSISHYDCSSCTMATPSRRLLNALQRPSRPSLNFLVDA